MPTGDPRWFSHWEGAPRAHKAGCQGAGQAERGVSAFLDACAQAHRLPSLSLSFPICKSDDIVLPQMICWEDATRRM